MAMTTPTTHYATDFDDDFATACDQNVGYILSDTEDEISIDDPEFFTLTENYCVDCAIALEVL